MENYNKQQKKAIEYPAKPLLILAGAGTGKTSTIIGRMAHLIKKEKAQADSILALTFTNEAAKKLKNKLIDSIGEEGRGIDASTFHSFAQTQIIKYYQRLGYSDEPKVMNTGDSYYLLNKHYNDLGRLNSVAFRSNPIIAISLFKKYLRHLAII